jgi:hypothetical protein
VRLRRHHSGIRSSPEFGEVPDVTGAVMSAQIRIDPSRLSQFGDPAGSTFCLITNPGMDELFDVSTDAGYDGYRTVTFGPEDDFDELLTRKVPESAHVLVISPDHFFQSPDDAVLGTGRKLMAMACNSTPTSLPVIRHFLGVMERTSAADQAEFSDGFFDKAEQADSLEYRDEANGTSATLDHLKEGLVWNQQAGPLDCGEQQIVPSGEISVLPIEITDFHEDLRLPLEGEIVLRGYPILHNGTPSFSRADQARVHESLWTMRTGGVRCTVEGGRITGTRAVHPAAQPAVDMLQHMFAVDSRYRIVWEIGHALNVSLDILPGNHAMNEVYGGVEGCLHWGLGLTPFTQYHLDIISPGTSVVGGSTGAVLIGTPGREPVERVAAAG